MSRVSKSSSLTKSALFTKLVEKTGLKKSEIVAVFEALTDITEAELKHGSSVTIPGLVKIKMRHKKASPSRKGRNPATGETITIKAKPARKVVKSYLLKNLKELGK